MRGNMGNTKDIRPWGSFTILADEQNFKVKILTVSPHKRLSLQAHQRREENWVVVVGEALVQIDDEFLLLSVGQHVFIPKQTKHRLENQGDTDLIIIETQTGEYFGEDDIIRYADDFQRV